MNNNNRDDELNIFYDSSDNNGNNGGFKVNSDEFDISSNDSEDVLDLNSYFKEEGIDFDEVNISSKSRSQKNKKGKSGNSLDKKGVKLLGFITISSGVANVLKVILAILMAVVIVICAGVGAVVGYVFLSVDGTMDVDLTKLELSYATTVYTQTDEGEWVEYQRLHGSENRVWVDYDKDLASSYDEEYTGVPQNLADAFVAIEDKRFFDHEGVDWRRTISAFVTMVTNRTTSGHGGSSITQQLVKNLTKDTDRSASRKVREIMRARYLEKEFTKEVILECYMNTIPMGNGLYGVEVASEYYFGKNVSELTLAECASIAGITNIPEYYRPDTNPENNKERRNLVLKLMYDQKLITEEEYETAKAEELVVVGDKSAIKEAPINNYFIDALIDDVVGALMDEYDWDKATAEENFYNGGFKIYSTLKPEVQSAIDEVFTDEKYALAGKKGDPLQGAMVVMDYSGNVVGMAGGMGEKTENRGLNRAIMSPRQPGSTIKPISAYAPAIERDLITYSSIVDDASVYYNNNTWRPTNWYLSYKGKVTVEYALEISMNTIPVYLCDLLTLQRSYDFLTQDLGITSLTKKDIDYSPLGMGGTNGGLTTMESAAAFAIFGNGGRYYEPITFTQIYDQFDDLVVSRQSTMRVAISEDTATVMNKLLQNVVYGSSGTGGGARSYVPNMKVYAKTGTANNTNDIWFVGGTPYYVGSTWCGYDQLETIRDSARAQKMWGAVMSKVHKNLPAKNFNFSKQVQCKLYCSETGLLANTGCPINDYGWYKASTNAYCDVHSGEKIGGTTEAQAKENLSKYMKETGTPNAPADGNTDQSGENTSSDENSAGTPTD